MACSLMVDSGGNLLVCGVAAFSGAMYRGMAGGASAVVVSWLLMLRLILLYHAKYPCFLYV